MAKPMRAPELHYPMIQFLITSIYMLSRYRTYEVLVNDEIAASCRTIVTPKHYFKHHNEDVL